MRRCEGKVSERRGGAAKGRCVFALKTAHMQAATMNTINAGACGGQSVTGRPRCAPPRVQPRAASAAWRRCDWSAIGCRTGARRCGAAKRRLARVSARCRRSCVSARRRLVITLCCFTKGVTPETVQTRAFCVGQAKRLLHHLAVFLHVCLQQLDNATARDISRGLAGLERVVAEHGVAGVHGRLVDLIDCAVPLSTAVEVTAGAARGGVGETGQRTCQTSLFACQVHPSCSALKFFNIQQEAISPKPARKHCCRSTWLLSRRGICPRTLFF
eukprot:366510-Chlamydomonas_euryale.AAC.24